MLQIPPILTNREMSGFPLSIGTGLALEAIFAPEQESLHEAPPTQLADVNTYSSYIFNVETLTRNLISSLKYQDLIGVANKHFLSVIIEEVDYLSSFFEMNNTRALFYVNSYKYFKDTYRDKIRKPTTDKQLLISGIVEYVLKHIVRERTNVANFSKEISFGKEERSLLLSHIPADLLSFRKFSTLDLLESHTGSIKHRRHWNTKYYPIPKEDMTFLPFIEYLLTTFGDRHMFKPSPMKERTKVLEHMRKQGVNPLTSEFGMLLNLTRNK